MLRGSWLRLIVVGVALASVPMLDSSSAQDQETEAQRTERLRWWREARFGMFIHWGPVSLKGTEIGWSRGAQVPIEEYDSLYKRFDPVKFDADAWAKTARAAGMKYVVFTTKHHDGFCMFDTKQTDFNIMRSPFGRDVVKELAAACRKEGLVFGTYHSVCDWHHPDFPLTSPGGKVKRSTSNLDRYESYLRAQVAELIQNYGPLGIMWFDVPQEFGGKRGEGLLAYTRSLQPSIIVNNRSGAPGDYDTPEQRVGKYQDDRPWETCMTICNQWAWKPNDEMKSLEQCLHNLILCASGDGNLLFNVGPTPEGVIEPRQVDRLKEMGKWLDQNGDTIYGTRGGPWKPTSAIASTRKGNSVFLHLLSHKGETVELPDIAPRKVRSATGPDAAPVVVRQDGGKLFVTVPATIRRPIDTVIRLELDGPALDIPAVSIVPEVKASASNVFEKGKREFGPSLAFDGDTSSRWATDSGTRQAWIEAELPAPRRIGGVRIDEAFPGRVLKFELQYSDGGGWKPLFDGTTLGASFQKRFEPVIARSIRLEIQEATEGPTINEIEVLDP